LRAVAPAFAAAPFSGFPLARETHWPENKTAAVTNGVGEGAVLFEELAALLNAEAHGASTEETLAIKLQSDSSMISFRPRVWAGTTPKTLLGARATKKRGRSSPVQGFARAQSEC